MDTHVLFINGIPASGKSTVARKLKTRTNTFRVISGDDIVRQVPYEERLERADAIWSRMLDVVEERLERTGVIVDAALTATQVTEARGRFGRSAAFVILRIDEKVRAARQGERDRRGNPLGYAWHLSYHSMPGGDELYDLVLDAGTLTAKQCASRILQFALDQWPDA